MKTVAGNRGDRNESLLLLGNYRRLRRVFLISCLSALILSMLSVHIDTSIALRKSCQSVSEGFASIMQSYKHSFRLFEKLLELEIASADNADEIEAFLKKSDAQLLDIEGGDYDGVYMYYQGRYMYSWSTPYEVYLGSGYDATKRPWYIGAMKAKGEIFFSVPYPSYANDYMLATISRVQPDGETVIAYDIKLGEISKYVDKLELFSGALTFICDEQGNVIGSTDHLYQGGNCRLSEEALMQRLTLANDELLAAGGENEREKAQRKVQSVQAQIRFHGGWHDFLTELLSNDKTLRYSPHNLSLGYAYTNGAYTCFVLSPISALLPKIGLVWAALSFFFMLAALLLSKVIGRSNQILTDALTGLNNRRALIRYCDNHIQHHPNDDICLIMLDLDDFKQINDKHGHVAGDHALLDTADALRKSCAEAPCNYFLCRYGGDEFLLAGTNCNREDIEQTRRMIENNLSLKNKQGDNPYVLKASMGIAGGRCADKSQLEYLLSQADKAMYAQKLNAKCNVTQSPDQSDRLTSREGKP